MEIKLSKTHISLIFILGLNQVFTISLYAKPLNFHAIEAKAQSMVLQKKRGPALLLIRQQMDETRNKNNKEKLLELQVSLSELFISEKTQQVYEGAMSLVGKDNPGAMNRLMDAKTLESDNMKVVTALAKLAIIQGQFDLAEKTLETAIKWGYKTDEVLTLLGASYLGVNKLKEFDELKPHNVQSSRWGLLELERAFKAKDSVRIANGLIQLARLDPQHPELQYWKFKTDNAQIESARKYLEECKKLFSSAQREYRLDPFLCQRVGEVEAGVEKYGKEVDRDSIRERRNDQGSSKEGPVHKPL